MVVFALMLLLLLLYLKPYRFRRAWTCLKPSPVWSMFTPYKTLCESDAGLVNALQDRREMFCITDPDLYDNPIGKFCFIPKSQNSDSVSEFSVGVLDEDLDIYLCSKVRHIFY